MFTWQSLCAILEEFSASPWVWGEFSSDGMVVWNEGAGWLSTPIFVRFSEDTCYEYRCIRSFICHKFVDIYGSVSICTLISFTSIWKEKDTIFFQLTSQRRTLIYNHSRFVSISFPSSIPSVISPYYYSYYLTSCLYHLSINRQYLLRQYFTCLYICCEFNFHELCSLWTQYLITTVGLNYLCHI